MNPDGVPEVVEEMPDSITGARGRADHEAPAPAPAPAAQQKGEKQGWIVEINNRLYNEYANAERYFGAPARNENEIMPSIFLTGRPPKKFYIGYLLRHDWTIRDIGQSEMWKYAAFMTRKLGLDVNGCLEFLEGNEKLIRDYYEDEYQTRFIGDRPEFLASLLVASCFQCLAIFVLLDRIMVVSKVEFIYSDPIFNGLKEKILSEATQTQLDMLNPENQIPWIIVKEVYERSNLSKADIESLDREVTLKTIECLAILAFDNLYPRANKSKVTDLTFPQEGFKHLLDLFHWTRTPSESKYMFKFSLQNLKSIGEFFIPNATELLGSTTVFKKLDGACSCDVVYSEKRISAMMQLGPLHLFPYSRELYSNLIIFEQYNRYWLGRGLAVTTHFACMKSLLQTKEDVKLLQKKGIVQNILEGEKDVLNFVHGMGKFLLEERNIIIPDELDKLSKKVIEHHEKSISRACTEIKNQFCPNKWVIISIIAGIILFVLTFIQTIYSGLGYYKT